MHFSMLLRTTLRSCHYQSTSVRHLTMFTRSPAFSTKALWQQQYSQQHGQQTKHDTAVAASTLPSAQTQGQAQEENACPTTVARPRLSPLPYIYLRDLPYNRSTDLQQLLVNRQIRLRKQREDLRALLVRQEDSEAWSGPDPSNSLSTPASTSISASSSVSASSSLSSSEHDPVREDGSTDLVLLVEHTPTYTNGRRNRGAQAISEQEAVRLQSQGATYVESLRGGEITFHGPGQLVAYPILDLKPIQLSVRCYVSYLEKAIIATCAEWGVKAITTDNTGVWINDQKKIAAIGVQVQRYITSHGLALNCNTDLEFFNQIVACGLVGKETTSLSRELADSTVNVQKVIPTFLKGFGATFNRELVPLSKINQDLEKRILEYVKTGEASYLDDGTAS